MHQTDRKRYIIVSLFIVAGLIIFLAAVFTLGGKQKRFVKTIEVKTTMDDVSGLIAGNNIWFSGVKVGTVKAVKFLSNSKVEVTMNIVAESQQYIRKDSKARLSSEGLIGNRIIAITDGSAESPAIEDGDVIAALEVSSSDQIMETLQENNKNLVAVTGNLKELTQKILNGEGALGSALTDKEMARDLKNVLTNLSNASEGINQSAGNINLFTRRLNTSKGSVNRLLNDTTAYASIQTSLKQLQLATDNALQVSESMKVVGENVEKGESAAGVLLNDKEAAAQLKNMIKQLESSSLKLNDNLEAMQHNFLLRGFFKKKNRAEQK